MTRPLDLLATGYPSVDRIFGVAALPQPGETATITALDDRTHAGGCGANVAVGLARLGLRSGVACVIGTDPEGDAFRRHLEQEGVDTRGVTRVPGARTSRSYLFSDPGGTVVNFFYPGAAGSLREEPDLSGLPPCRMGLVTVGPPAYNRAFLRALRRRGVPVVVQMRIDKAAYDPLLEEAVRSAWGLLMNHHEARFLAERFGLGHVRELVSDTTRAVVVTRGAQGAEVWTPDGHWRVPAAPVQAVVDTTGAGDAFTAGFLAGVLWEWPMPAALRLGATVAAFVVEQVGAQEGLPDRKRLVDRLSAMGETDLARRILAIP
ncbi:MAG: PfkB family carbohydrate kinase [Bacillota bacterium]